MKKVFATLFFLCPFAIVFSLPLLDLEGQKSLKLPIKSQKEYVVLYFGYPGCGKSCPGILTDLASIFDKNKLEKIEVKFINILAGIDSATTSKYAQAYHKSFASMNLNKAEEEELFQTFGIQKEKTYSEDLEHSNYLFFLKKDNGSYWTLRRAFQNTEKIKIFLTSNIKEFY